jgi:hypothetical protein
LSPSAAGADPIEPRRMKRRSAGSARHVEVPDFSPAARKLDEPLRVEWMPPFTHVDEPCSRVPWAEPGRSPLALFARLDARLGTGRRSFHPARTPQRFCAAMHASPLGSMASGAVDQSADGVSCARGCGPPPARALFRLRLRSLGPGVCVDLGARLVADGGREHGGDGPARSRRPPAVTRRECP